MTVAGDRASSPPDHGPVVADYEALRTDVGALALARDVLRVSGPDALGYLQGQLSQDLDGLGVGESTDALILTPQGKLDALVRVSRTGDEEVILDVEGGFGEAVAARLARFKLRVKVVIEPLAWRATVLRGPRAAEVAIGSGPGTALAPPFSWNGVSGVDLVGESPPLPAGVRVCGVEAGEALRIEAGIPVMGAELDERTIAAEADLLDRAVSFTKGCYTGQELVARLDARGNRVARHLRGLVVAGPAPGGVAPGSEIVFEGKVVGTVTSSAWSPHFRCPVALGYVHRAVDPPSPVDVRPVSVAGSPGTADASVVGAEVRALPLV